MIDYELAKQLKDAGFPQKCDVGDWFFDQHGKRWWQNLNTARLPQMDCLCPTLEELIEVCGEGFGGLDKVEMGWTTWGWRTERLRFSVGIYSTPTEAVARLWLALNSKK